MREEDALYLVKGAELQQWLQQNPCDEAIDLTTSDIRRWQIGHVPVQATARQAMDKLHSDTIEAVCVNGRMQGGKKVLLGVLTRDIIERSTFGEL
jgi:hypothetical protein